MADNLDDNGLDEYPNYEEDDATLASFLQEHTILSPIEENASLLNNNNLEDDLLLEEPGSNGLHRVPAYLPQLQRIRNRDYRNPDDHIIEIPLDELKAWDGVRGNDLGIRTSKNALRYHQLFCTVIDRILDSLEDSANSNHNHFDGEEDEVFVRDSFDVLQEQRLANRRRRRQEIQQRNESGDLLGVGGIENDPQNANVVEEEFPPALMRRYELRILPFGRKGPKTTTTTTVATKDLEDNDDSTSSSFGLPLRHVRSRSMGRLVTISGMIVRASDVKPQCVVATYTCDQCGVEIYQDVQNKREFMPHRKCPNEACGQMDCLHLQTRGSKFVKFQELKIQELPQQVPMGHIPRSMPILCRGSLTRIASPGDVVTVDGVFLPMRIAEGGYRAMKAGLISTTYLECMNINVHKKSFDETSTRKRKRVSPDDEGEEIPNVVEDSDVEVEAELMKIATGDDPVFALSQSLAPEIYGHIDIKRALLLQLVGGCERRLPDGMRIRGDINICQMGDPGVAKSQLLKHVSSIAPRGVYTTGRGSSGVGLTAAVTKDSTTGEMALEGGALVLADKGICCIDEFDKMDEGDRTAIHEVMEQQTVSIAKAGIVATLNARSAVLAAANPLYGRYNRKKSLSENINLPNSLLSRFDLLFLVLDKADVDKDMALARHVTFVHKNNGLTDISNDNQPNKDDQNVLDDDTQDENATTPTEVSSDTANGQSKPKPIALKILREYISRAREYQPVVPPDVGPYIVEAYVGLRIHDQSNGSTSKNSSNLNNDQTVMTARQLLSILRLSQALARLRFSDFVAREDVDEAIRLTHMSKASLLDDDEDGGVGGSSADGGKKRQGREDVISRIFNAIREYSVASRKNRVELQIVEAMILRKGFTVAQLQTCLEEYQALQIIQINSTGTHISFMD